MDFKLKRIIFKTCLFILSLSVAWYIMKGPFLKDLLDAVLPVKFLSEFIAGMLYASFFTSPISLAMLAVLAKGSNPVAAALIAGLGAAFSDLLIIRFFKFVSKDFDLVSGQMRLNKLSAFLSKWKLEFLIPLIGAFIIASPLPDELGLIMLGASNLRYYQIAILTYLLNTAGILLIILPVSLIS